MITSKRIREYLTAQPFRPFRIFLSDGSHHDVPHPEFAWVFGNSLFVGEAGRNPLGLDDSVRQLSLLHLTRIEPLAKRKSRK